MYFEGYVEFIDMSVSNIDNVTFLKDYFFPVKYRGNILPKYYVDSRGQIFSVKKGYRTPTKITYNNNSGNCGYPKIRIDTSPDLSFTLYKTVTVHRLVCESFYKKPIPHGVTKKEWQLTPESVKKCFDDYWEVNHKDHNTYNYHPSNLEWVSRQQNVDKYQEYLKG